MSRLMGQKPELNCLYQKKSSASPIERQLLGIKPRCYSHVREISMGEKSLPWLFARTVIPLKTLQGQSKRLAKIDKTPLGKLLFGQGHGIRRDMQVDLVKSEHISAESVHFSQFNVPDSFLLWQRRSIFELETGPLIITEIFLPGCPIYSTPPMKG